MNVHVLWSGRLGTGSPKISLVEEVHHKNATGNPPPPILSHFRINYDIVILWIMLWINTLSCFSLSWFKVLRVSLMIV